MGSVGRSEFSIDSTSSKTSPEAGWANIGILGYGAGDHSLLKKWGQQFSEFPHLGTPMVIPNPLELSPAESSGLRSRAAGRWPSNESLTPRYALSLVGLEGMPIEPAPGSQAKVSAGERRRDPASPIMSSVTSKRKSRRAGLAVC
jgi:hypothetical protein